MSETEIRRFVDRRDAGRRLAAVLRSFAEEQPIVVGLARGGVPVAYEVAQALEVAARRAGCAEDRRARQP
jgi:predicted phosphoribosyltransferase